jgi:hypothetical protein
MNEPECGPEVAKRYRALPTDPHIKEEVTDMWSKYSESTSICSQPKTYSSVFLIYGFTYISSNDSIILFIHFTYN